MLCLTWPTTLYSFATYWIISRATFFVDLRQTIDSIELKTLKMSEKIVFYRINQTIIRFVSHTFTSGYVPRFPYLNSFFSESFDSFYCLSLSLCLVPLVLPLFKFYRSFNNVSTHIQAYLYYQNPTTT